MYQKEGNSKKDSKKNVDEKLDLRFLLKTINLIFKEVQIEI